MGIGSKATRQGKLMQLILSPVRILKKAAEFYVKGMENCAGRVDQYGGAVSYPAVHVTRLPKSFSVNSSKGSDDHEDARLISRTASKKNLENKVIMSFDMQRQREIRTSNMGTAGENGMGIRSYSVGLGKIGRIDEDQPCYFDEGGVIVEAELYPRSRSYAVKRNGVYR